MKVRTSEVNKEIAVGKQPLASSGTTLEQPITVDDDGAITGNTSPPEQGRKKARQDSPPQSLPVDDAEEEIRRVRAEADARLQEFGVMPIMEDLAACKRLGDSGFELFRKAYLDYPVKLANALRGKIASTKSETRHYARRLETVQAEFSSQQALDVSIVLAPWIEMEYYDMGHTGKDDKIWKDGEVIITGDKYRKRLSEAAEQEESPGSQAEHVEMETEAANGKA